MAHIATETYVWDFENLPEAFFLMWEDHFSYLDPTEDGLKVEIEYCYSPGTAGKTDGPPERCYPPEDPEVEILSTIVTVPYSSDGAKANHLDAYPPCNSETGDGLHCMGQPEFVNQLLAAWEAWFSDDKNERAVEAWLMDKAVENEEEMVLDALVDMAEARASYNSESY